MLTNFNTTHVDVTPTLLTSAYVSGRTLFDATVIPIEGAIKYNTRRGRITQVSLVDSSDQGINLDLYLFSGPVTFGTANVAPSISDADALTFLGRIAVDDYYDLGGVQVSRPSFEPIEFETQQRKLWVAAVTLGTPTYASNGLLLRFAIQLENSPRE